jgi:hypothetical protein
MLHKFFRRWYILLAVYYYQCRRTQVLLYFFKLWKKVYCNFFKFLKKNLTVFFFIPKKSFTVFFWCRGRNTMWHFLSIFVWTRTSSCGFFFITQKKSFMESMEFMLMKVFLLLYRTIPGNSEIGIILFEVECRILPLLWKRFFAFLVLTKITSRQYQILFIGIADLGGALDDTGST